MKMSLVLLLAVAALQWGWSQQTYTVSGIVTLEDGTPVPGVEVLSGNANVPSVFTNSDGSYELEFPAGGDGVVAPFNDSNPINGVSSFDLVLIWKHIAGITLLDSPYKIIAADVDHSNTLNPADTSVLRSVILGLLPNFPNNTSWRFVDANYAFPNPGNPFEATFPEFLNVNAISSDITGVDFIAVKVGDVNATSTTGAFLNSSIRGNVYFDQDETCTHTPGDTPLTNWKVVATGNNGTFYGNTQANGDYLIFLTPGTYDVSIVQENSLWAPCTASVPNIVAALQTATTVDFAEQAVENCAAMEVELSTWFLRRCFANSYMVNYCNQGTETAADASVEVTLDPYFINVGSTLPWASVNGNAYTFNVGDVEPGECGYFYIHFEVDCNAELGQTHCTSAHVYPDSSCVEPNALWSGADLLVSGECVGDDVVFTITNTGDDMTEPVEYVVIEDIMIQLTESLQLPAGGSETVTRTANGATWRLETEEAAYHPYETFASATVEGCPDGFNPMSYGFFNLFPMPDEAPFEDIDCQDNIGSYDPNDKTGFPLGVGEQRFIELGQPLDYLIRFQNTGTDTAFNILVIDSLPQTVDPASIHILGSSHPMSFVLGDRGVARFYFNSIMLPDSNVNEALSHGFVKFSIAQKPGLPLGTTIENKAEIYFDFNEAIVTNRTLHTLGEDFLMEVSAAQTLVKGLEMEVFPNPTQAIANFRFKGHDLKEGQLTLFDQYGQSVRQMAFVGNACQLDGSGLASGVYFFKVEDAGMGIASGKLIVK
ncbi:MAG: T9SS type A sorting domain-containing protein [Saprospiraceae bacterium]|nr:T9SS type A sorting domain-containing protein [Saprospiraceae bacterium]